MPQQSRGVIMEKLLRVKLSELSTLRITCGACGIVTELKLTDLPAKEMNRCKHCDSVVIASEGGRNQVSTMALAILQLQKNSSATFEFVIPQAE